MQSHGRIFFRDKNQSNKNMQIFTSHTVNTSLYVSQDSETSHLFSIMCKIPWWYHHDFRIFGNNTSYLKSLANLIFFHCWNQQKHPFHKSSITKHPQQKSNTSLPSPGIHPSLGPRLEGWSSIWKTHTVVDGVDHKLMTKPVMARHIHPLGWFSDIWHPIEINRLGPEHVRQDQEKHLHFAWFLAFTFFLLHFSRFFCVFCFYMFLWRRPQYTSRAPMPCFSEPSQDLEKHGSTPQAPTKIRRGIERQKLIHNIEYVW